MKAILWLILALPLAAQAQLALYTVDGTIETLLLPNSVFQLRSMEAGETQSLRLRVRNAGQLPAEITRFVADGAGFSLNRPLPPITLAAGGFLNATLAFTANTPANYSANLQLNGISVLVLANVTTGPQLTVPGPCSGASAGTVDFGTLTRGQSRTCDLSLSNTTNQPMTISTVAVSGAGYSLSQIEAPLTLAAGQTRAFAVQFTSQTVGVLTGTLKIQAREYPLRAVSVEAPLPEPIFEFESSPAASGQQRRLTMRLSAPSPVTTTGQLSLVFLADSVTAADDPAVMFVETSSRQLSFALEAGKTTVTLNGQPFATFQTGTTAGRIRFHLSGISSGFAGNAESTVILAPGQITIAKVVPSRFPNRVELVIQGFDNTFSAGSMLFRFFDNGGQLITAAIPADFTSEFRNFFATSPGGSTFQLTIRFPISGSSSSIAAVEAELANSAGTVRTTRLAF